MGKDRLPGRVYDAELFRLQAELVTMQEWIRAGGRRVVVIFEGRDAAGKGGTIKRISQYLSPRVVRIVAPLTLELPPRPTSQGYERPPRVHATYVPDHCASLTGGRPA